MCGIAGLYDNAISTDERLQMATMMGSALAHRGPDDSGIWSSETVPLTFVHRRLAIQDLSTAGAQPMPSASGRYRIVFNGEVYNFRDLKRELERRRHTFRGHSDTEVLLAAIEEWGLNTALKRTVGMFAFALWDDEQRSLALCRDRMGEKPLYYGWLGKTFCFASELKALRAIDAGNTLQINADAVAAYLRFFYVPAPLSIYRHIYKLPPGTILTFSVAEDLANRDFNPHASRSSFSPQPYWSIRQAAEEGLANPLVDEKEATDAIDSLLRRTIEQQLVADVSVGAFLSGGIDSSTVCALAQQQAAGGIRTYTIGFDDTGHDESRHAEAIAKHIGSDHLTLQASARDGLALVPGLGQMFDEPFADSSQIPTYIVSRLARDHVTVCLSGDGGDELFAGYNRYIWTDRLWKRSHGLPKGLRQMLASLGTRVLGGTRLHKAARVLQSESIEEGYAYLLSYWHDPRLTTLPDVGQTDLFEDVPKVISQFIDRAMYVDQTGYLPGDNLCKVDRASMAVSLETRLPMLSHEIVELSWRVPLAMKVREGQSKWLLRQVLYRYVPRQLVERPKMGFTVPLRQWLNEDLNAWANDTLALLDTKGNDFFSKEAVMHAWREQNTSGRDHSAMLWSVLMFLSWLDTWS